jgi:hypothetical protein
MKTYDLYGFTHDDLEAARVAVEQALGITFEPHYSFYIGDYYLFEEEGEESFELRRNVDPLDGEPAEQAFPEIGVLLYVNGTERSRELEQILSTKIAGLCLLRREWL